MLKYAIEMKKSGISISPGRTKPVNKHEGEREREREERERERERERGGGREASDTHMIVGNEQSGSGG